ncbi:MAG: hypothetical protein HC874_02070 [Richelia sp. SL_2_1]|uniref:Uncharacterized protein n=2 Tax=Plectonema TaxID=1183 RepID=A0A8J7K3Y5_9CYAN|nr:hypothetical protein [Plectonema cf. radiosum LEGE 06105]NJO26439.1 hypothetical protein [Richelia sp. SL_2_1]
MFWFNLKVLFSLFAQIFLQTMDVQTIKERIALVESKREYLLSLLEQPNLGTLRIDVNQAIEEMDELLDEYKRTFP